MQELAKKKKKKRPRGYSWQITLIAPCQWLSYYTPRCQIDILELLDGQGWCGLVGLTAESAPVLLHRVAVHICFGGKQVPAPSC